MKKYLILLFALVAIPSFAQNAKSVEGVVKTTENEYTSSTVNKSICDLHCEEALFLCIDRTDTVYWC
jgi:hypothetical protein